MLFDKLVLNKNYCNNKKCIKHFYCINARDDLTYINKYLQTYIYCKYYNDIKQIDLTKLSFNDLYILKIICMFSINNNILPNHLIIFIKQKII